LERRGTRVNEDAHNKTQIKEKNSTYPTTSPQIKSPPQFVSQILKNESRNLFQVETTGEENCLVGKQIVDDVSFSANLLLSEMRVSFV
jgi:hypothetical protein